MATKDVTNEMVCRAVHYWHTAMKESGWEANIPWPYEALAAETEEPEKVCYRAMERAERQGLIEYGVSLRTGWLTPKGLELIGLDPVKFGW